MSQQSITLRSTLAMTIRRLRQTGPGQISIPEAIQVYNNKLRIFTSQLIKRPEAEWDNQWAHELLSELYHLIKQKSPESQIEEIQSLTEEKQFAELKDIALKQL